MISMISLWRGSGRSYQVTLSDSGSHAFGNNLIGPKSIWPHCQIHSISLCSPSWNPKEIQNVHGWHLVSNFHGILYNMCTFIVISLHALPLQENLLQLILLNFFLSLCIFSNFLMGHCCGSFVSKCCQYSAYSMSFCFLEPAEFFSQWFPYCTVFRSTWRYFYLLCAIPMSLDPLPSLSLPH